MVSTRGTPSQVEAWGESEEDTPDEDDENDDDDDGDDSEGMAARLDQILQDLTQTNVTMSRAGAFKGPQGEPRDGSQKEASPHRPHADTPPAPAQGRAVPPPHFQRLARAIGSKPRRWGR